MDVKQTEECSTFGLHPCTLDLQIVLTCKTLICLARIYSCRVTLMQGDGEQRCLIRPVKGAGNVLQLAYLILPLGATLIPTAIDLPIIRS